MMVERYTRVDVLDMTWAHFWECLGTLPELRRIQSGRPMTHEDRIRQQKEQQTAEL